MSRDQIVVGSESTMQVEASSKDFEKIAHYLHRIAAREPPHKQSELAAAKRLGNLIADAVSAQRNKWLDERHRWNRETLEEFIYRQGKTLEEIAEIEGVPVEKVEKVLRRFGFLQPKTKK